MGSVPTVGRDTTTEHARRALGHNDVLATLGTVPGSDVEVVDASGLQVGRHLHQARPTG